MKRRYQWSGKSLALFLLLLAAFSVFAMFCGRYRISLREFACVLTGAAAEDGRMLTVRRVLFRMRLPRILFSMLAGAGLAAAGASLQGICANPLATMDTIGTAGGASFGAALGILFELGGVWIRTLAFVCGMAATGLVFFLCRRQRQERVLMLVLAGLAVNSLFSALLAMVKYVADPQDQLPVITHWLLGSMNSVTWQSVRSGFLWMAGGSVLIWLFRWQLNAMTLPEDEARALGVRPSRVRWCVIFASAAVTAAVTSVCGQIGWIGLLVPHACRLLFGGDYRKLIPAGMCLGALLLLVMDTAARSLFAAEIPVAILTAAVGAPGFLLLLCGKDGLRL